MQTSKDSHSPELLKKKRPPGFTYIHGPDDQLVLVPTFLVPATELALEVQRSSENVDLNMGTQGVSALVKIWISVLLHSS